MKRRGFTFYQAWCFLKRMHMVAVLGLVAGFFMTPIHAQIPRIVTLDASLTETVYALGKGAWVVGRDSISLYPDAARKLPDVGYHRTLTADTILALKPTLVLATSDAEPQAVLQKLQGAGVEVITVDNHFSIRGLQNKIMMVANRLKVASAGDKLVKKVQSQVKGVQAKTVGFRALDKSPSALFVLRNAEEQWMVAGAQSRADEFMKMVGVYNPVAATLKGYVPLTPEAILAHQPQLIITLPRTVKAAGGYDAFVKSPLISLSRAGQKGRVVVLNDGDLSFGPRLGDALQRLTDGILRYPEISDEATRASGEKDS